MAKKREELRIDRPVVWIIGASRGIGREVGKAFASIGCEVILSSRTLSDLKVGVRQITDTGGHATGIPCDISRPVTVAAAVKRIETQFGKLDILINNAGVTTFKTFLETTMEELDEIIGTNLRGYIMSIKAVLPTMVKRKNGWIINILSTAAWRTFEGSSVYTASKMGMLGFARVLREEVKEFNIKVVNVLPGPTDTDMWDRSVRRSSSHRMMQAKSVAEAILSLYQMPEDVVTDEVILRPIQGDLR